MGNGVSKKAIKSTKAEVELRVQTIVKWILQGRSYTDIVRYSAKNWGISSRQADNYVKMAKDDVKATTKITKEEQITLAIARYNDLYLQNYTGKDFRECRNVQDSLNKLLGLNEAEKIDITTKMEGMTEDQLYILTDLLISMDGKPKHVIDNAINLMITQISEDGTTTYE